jgi:hypothetical protein
MHDLPGNFKLRLCIDVLDGGDINYIFRRAARSFMPRSA